MLTCSQNYPPSFIGFNQLFQWFRMRGLGPTVPWRNYPFWKSRRLSMGLVTITWICCWGMCFFQILPWNSSLWKVTSWLNVYTSSDHQRSRNSKILNTSKNIQTVTLPEPLLLWGWNMIVFHLFCKEGVISWVKINEQLDFKSQLQP